MWKRRVCAVLGLLCSGPNLHAQTPATDTPTEPAYETNLADYFARLEGLFPNPDIFATPAPSNRQFQEAAYGERTDEVIAQARQNREELGNSFREVHNHKGTPIVARDNAINPNEYMILSSESNNRQFPVEKGPDEDPNSPIPSAMHFDTSQKGIVASQVPSSKEAPLMVGHEVGHGNQEWSKGNKMAIKNLDPNDPLFWSKFIQNYFADPQEVGVRAAEMKRNIAATTSEIINTPQQALEALGAFGLRFDDEVLNKFCRQHNLNPARYQELMAVREQLASGGSPTGLRENDVHLVRTCDAFSQRALDISSLRDLLSQYRAMPDNPIARDAYKNLSAVLLERFTQAMPVVAQSSEKSSLNFGGQSGPAIYFTPGKKSDMSPGMGATISKNLPEIG